MLNFEADEAGKLRAFRERFGRGWDAGAARSEDEREGERDDGGELEGEGAEMRRDKGGKRGDGDGDGEDNLMDLISGFGRGEEAGVREGKERSGKRKGGER